MRRAEDVGNAVTEAKRIEGLLRDARAALRRVDVLAAQALATENSTASVIGEARSALENVVRELTRQRQDALRRGRAALRQGR